MRIRRTAKKGFDIRKDFRKQVLRPEAGLRTVSFANKSQRARNKVAALIAMDNAELITLITAVSRRDRAAFGKLYERVAPKLFAILLRILRNRATAEDVLQDVFLKIWQNAESFSEEAGPPMGWLISIARNRAIDILRSKNPAEPAVDTDAADLFARIAEPGDREAEMMDIAALRHCLGMIEEPARTCILLAYYEGYSRDELARRFDRPVNTIKTWLHRSLAALKSCLESVT
jgi:RNA polymerase sigma factor (sigma-70 family)